MVADEIILQWEGREIVLLDDIRKLKHWWRRRRRQGRKMNLYFTFVSIPDMFSALPVKKSAQINFVVQEINSIGKYEELAVVAFVLKQTRRTGSFHVPVLQRTAMLCTKVYNALAPQLVCS